MTRINIVSTCVIRSPSVEVHFVGRRSACVLCVAATCLPVTSDRAMTAVIGTHLLHTSSLLQKPGPHPASYEEGSNNRDSNISTLTQVAVLSIYILLVIANGKTSTAISDAHE